MSNERAQRINTMLTPEVIEYLDEQTRRIRQRTQCRVSRSELLRGIVRALASQHVLFESCGTEEDIAIAFADFLARPTTVPDRQYTSAQGARNRR